MTTSAELLRTTRERAGLSMRALAERAGTAYTTISRIENGQLDPTFGMLSRLATAAGHQLDVDMRVADTPQLATLADAWHRDRRGQDRPDWTRLRVLLDRLALHPELTGPATVLRPAPSGSGFMDNLLAGVAEKLSDDAGLPRPSWTKAVAPLAETWSTPMTPRMQTIAAATTPAQLAARGITLTEDSLWRKPIAPDA